MASSESALRQTFRFSRLAYPKLHEHLGPVVTIMKLSNNWHDFMDKLNRLHLPHGKPMQLALDYGPDAGKGL